MPNGLNRLKRRSVFMKNFKTRLFSGMILLACAVVISAVVFFILAMTSVIVANAFQLCFAILTLGIGVVFAIYGLVTKGGYELAVSFTLILVGVIIALIGVLAWYFILVIALAIVVLAFLALILLKADKLIVKTTDEDPNFKSYTEQLEEKKAQDAIDEMKPLPELKDYSKED